MFPWLVSYSSNIYQSINNVYIGDFNHFWSLCVEEQFYLFWPFVILFSRPKKTLSIIIITIIISLIIRLFFFLYIEKWMATSYFTLNCMHALGLGALLSYIKLYKPKTSKALTKSKWLVIIASLYICSLLFKRPLNLAWYKDTIDEFFFAVVAFFIIAIASENGFKGIFKFILENKFIKYSGQISYGLYVYHLFIPELYFFISPRIGLGISNKYTFFVVMYFLTFLVAHISWKLIESPINKFKDKVPYLKSAHE